MNRRRTLMILLGIVLGLAILLPIFRHYQLRFAVASYIAQLKAKGEPFELSQVMPPVVPAERNGAETLREADALFGASEDLFYTNDAGGMKMVAPGKAAVVWQQPDIRESDETNSWENVKAIVARNAKAFGLLQQIVQTPAFDFHIRDNTGVADLDFSNLALVETKRSAVRLHTAIESNLHYDDTTAAVTNLRSMLALDKAMRDERLAITELVRIAIAQIALVATWEVLQSTNLTETQLAAVQDDWTSLEFIHAGENALAMERVTGEITLEKQRGSYSEFLHCIGLGEQARTAMGFPEHLKSPIAIMKVKGEFFLWRYWWSYRDELRYLKGLEVLTDSLRSAAATGCFQDALVSQGAALDRLGISKLVDSIDSIFSGEMDFHSMQSQSVVALSGFARRIMRVEAAKEMVTAAISLKRYQLKHGNYPPALGLLAPEFIAKIPLDPVDGNPLRYRRNSDGTFLLYSVGENGRDDGGDPSLEKGVTSSSYGWENPHDLDWVWPQTATDAEIKTYYDSRAKGSN
jgi:hypothetical protein